MLQQMHHRLLLTLQRRPSKAPQDPIPNHIPRAVTVSNDRNRTRTAPDKYEHNPKRARYSNPPDVDDDDL